jgi:hypothetical protein
MSSTVPFAGMKQEDGKPRPDFRTGVPREVQVGKAAFGRGPWRVMLEVGGTRNVRGEWTPLRWPADGDPDDPAGWATLAMSSVAADVLERPE